MRDVALYFDFLSPYSWLALEQAPAFAVRHGVRWDLRPVVLGKLLDATGRVGTSEVEAKRVAAGRDVARCAALLGLPFRGPPAHPFRSLDALRAASLWVPGSSRAARILRAARTGSLGSWGSSPCSVDDARGLRLCLDLARAAWSEGRDIADLTVITEVVAGCGLDAGDLADRLAAPSTKGRLRRLTDEAIARGVFGVPTFELDGELLWGQDRLSHLAARLEGRLAIDEEALADFLARPRAVDRAAARRRSQPSASARAMLRSRGASRS